MVPVNDLDQTGPIALGPDGVPVGHDAGDDASSAPPVVAVVVTHDPGPWFEECLASLGAQDYPALDVLVIDAGSAEDPTPRVAAALPSAFVRRLGSNPGYGAAANEVLEVVEGALFYLHCHDDVALAPNAVRLLVQEAFRSNAGITGPKLVGWDEPGRIRQVGLLVDKTGEPAPLAEPGELDQEQHDGVRDVFAIPGGATLVRADLFAALGGFNDAIDFDGDDVDLCWRAQIAGARVVITPSAVARHVEAYDQRLDPEDRRGRSARHRLLTSLTCYSPGHLLRVLPQAAVLAVVEVVYAVLAGRLRHARQVAGAWPWALRRMGIVRAQRAHLKPLREMPDAEVRRLQVRGSARVTAFLRGQGTRSDDPFSSVAAAGRDFAGTLRGSSGQVTITVWAVVALLLGLGSRTLLAKGYASFGELTTFRDGPSALLGQWLSGWRSAGLGSESPAPTGFALLGLAGSAVLGWMELLRRLAVVVPLFVGALGAYRLGRDIGSARARSVVLVTYLAIPLPYNAIAQGRWGGLLVWAAVPWLVTRLARVTGQAPFGGTRPTRSVVQESIRLALPLAVVAAFAPFVGVVLLLIACGLTAGSVVTGRLGGTARMVAVALGAVVVAAVLHVPWTFDFALPGSSWSQLGGSPSAAGLPAGSLIRFETGPFGAGFLSYLFLLAAGLALLIGKGWRLAWATRAWALAVCSIAAAFVAQQDWFDWGLGTPEALLAPAAAALALSTGLGLASFEADLRGYRFGWRQLASIGAAASLALAVLPVLPATFGGRWKAPASGFERVLGFLEGEAGQGHARTLWVGDPSAVPVAGWPLADGLVYGTTERGLPAVVDRWGASADGATELLGDSLHAALEGRTNRLGRLVGAMGIRYVVVPTALAPSGSQSWPVPPELHTALAEQLDLEEVAIDPSVRVFRNAAWAPVYATLSGPAADAATNGEFFRSAIETSLADATPALTDQVGRTTASGPVQPGSTLLAAQGSSANWKLSVDGGRAERDRAFGWANGFRIEGGDGTASLRYHTPITRYGALAVQVALWVAAALAIHHWRGQDRLAAQGRRSTSDAASLDGPGAPAASAGLVDHGEPRTAEPAAVVPTTPVEPDRGGTPS